MWFRNDFRMDDNPALREACKHSDEVHAVYIYSQKQNQKHNEANCKTEFFIENLKVLESELSKINIPITIINSNGFKDNSKIIYDYVQNQSLHKVFWNKQFGVDEESRDKGVQELLEINNIDCFSYDAQVLFPAGTFKTGEGKPYSVFTPFKKKCKISFLVRLPIMIIICLRGLLSPEVLVYKKLTEFAISFFL